MERAGEHGGEEDGLEEEDAGGCGGLMSFWMPMRALPFIAFQC